jgi:hypothetical protein
VIAVGQVHRTAPTTLDHDSADVDELLERAVDRVLRLLLQSGRQQRSAGHPLAGALPVAQQHRVQSVGTVADVGVDDPFGHDREVLVDDQGALIVETFRTNELMIRRYGHGLSPALASAGP